MVMQPMEYVVAAFATGYGSNRQLDGTLYDSIVLQCIAVPGQRKGGVAPLLLTPLSSVCFRLICKHQDGPEFPHGTPPLPHWQFRRSLCMARMQHGR